MVVIDWAHEVYHNLEVLHQTLSLSRSIKEYSSYIVIIFCFDDYFWSNGKIYRINDKEVVIFNAFFLDFFRF